MDGFRYTTYKLTRLLFTFLFSCFLLVSCGDGGGGDSGLTYNGQKSQASIDSNNAVDITTASFKASSTGGSINTLGFSKTSGSDQTHTGPSRILTLVQTIEEVFREVDLSPPTQDFPLRQATGSVSNQIPGECGGNISYTIQADNQSGSFNGTFNFNNFCVNGTTLSGSVTVSGQIDINTSTFVSFNLSLNFLNVTSGNDTFTASGTMSFDFNASPPYVTMEILMKDTVQDKVFWLTNFSTTFTPGPGYVDMGISGRFYHPDHGFVDISTPAPLRINDTDDFPSSGTLVSNGANNTTAELSALSATTFQVVGYTDGDGLDDYDSGILN